MKGSGLSHSLSGVLALLLVVVIVPTAGVVWFMSAAMRNERSAARETLTKAHRLGLIAAAERVDSDWEARRSRLDTADDTLSAAEIFASVVRSGTADSVVVLDDDGEIRYPAEERTLTPTPIPTSAAWSTAQRLEFGEQLFLEAAEAYGALASAERDRHLAVQALLAQARCLGKAGRTLEAVRLISDSLTDERYRDARDSQGRLVVPSALLLGLHLVAGQTGEELDGIASALRARLDDYSDPAIPVAQRRFMMRRFVELLPDGPPLDTYRAESLAEAFLAAEVALPESRVLEQTGVAGIWGLLSADGRIVALFEEATIRASVVKGRTGIEAGSGLELLLAGEASQGDPFLTASVGASLPGWSLALHLDDIELVDEAASEVIAGYMWTGLLLVAAALLSAAIVASWIGRQVRLARLKNDLIATVTHELKTPLASMRLLVDTLLDEQHHDDTQVREYLELISRENTRLSRLIDDFLAFSRMERNKQAFEKIEIPPEDVANAAAEAVRPRLEEGDSSFRVEIANDLPRIVADPEALSTVLVNLLDNAYKYSSENKQITLRTYGENGSVVFDVEDNGIGLSRRSAKRVFERFYQVEDSLSSGGSGVGLGLAIVKFIVDAHRGEVSVLSEPGKGSTFRVKVPVATAESLRS